MVLKLRSEQGNRVLRLFSKATGRTVSHVGPNDKIAPDAGCTSLAGTSNVKSLRTKNNTDHDLMLRLSGKIESTGTLPFYFWV
jgi:hypothetical protein